MKLDARLTAIVSVTLACLQTNADAQVTGNHRSLVGEAIGWQNITPEDRALLDNFAETFAGRQRLRGFVGSQRALGDLIDMSKSPVSIDKLLNLSRETELTLEQAFDQVEAGVNVGALHALREQDNLSELRVMSAEDLQLFTSDAYLELVLESSGFPSKYQENIRILPVALGDRPIIIFPREPSVSVNLNLGPNDIDQIRTPFWRNNNFSVGPDSESPGVIPEISDGTNTQIALLELVRLDFEKRENEPSETGDCGVDNGRACFLFAVSLHDSGAVVCSGAQVAPGWVLTAAHCTCNRAPELASIGQVTPNRHGVGIFNPVIVPGVENFEADTDTAAVGADRYYFGDLPGKERQNTFCEKHAEFKAIPRPSKDETGNAPFKLDSVSGITKQWIKARDEAYSQRDLVLVKLSKPLGLFGHIPVAKIAEEPLFEEGRNYRVAGYGRNNWEFFGGHKTVLKGLHTGSECSTNRVTVGTGCVADRDMLLISSDSLTDSCNGDSGAGVYKVLPDGKIELMAIVSRAANWGLCGPGGVNSIVASKEVRDWIQTVIADG